jgi:hypothetical protein
MANIIRIKRRAAGGAAGAPASLASAELAYNEQDDTLYYGKGDNAGAATSIPAIGGPGAYLALAGAQTVTGDKTFSGTVALGANVSATTPAADNNSTKVATTAYVLGQAATANPAINGTAAAGSSTRFSRGDHVHPTDTSRAALASPTFTGTPAAPTAAADTNTTQLATTAFVLGQASSATPQALGSAAIGTATRYARADHVHAMPTLNQVGAPTADVALNSRKITGLATPTADTDAATKAYVDAIAQGISWKTSVRAATTANITLSGAQTIDGVSVVAGDRVLVKDQSTASTNGIYVAAAGAWSRATDADVSSEVPAGMALFANEGTVNGDKAWVLTTNAPITLGTTPLAFTQMTGSASGETNTASNVGASGVGIYDGKSGVDLQFRKLNAGSSTISVTLNGQKVDVDVVQANITGVGTIGSGTWQGTAVALGYGGTGANLSGAADGAIFKKSGAALVAATAGTDYLSASSTIDGGTF